MHRMASSSWSPSRRSGLVLELLLLVVVVVVLPSIWSPDSSRVQAQEELTSSYLSPPIPLSPGQVSNKFYYSVPFPNTEADIGVKNFEAELVYENGTSAPLFEVYLHHWIVINYWNRTDGNGTDAVTIVGNSGLCPNNSLTFIFGVGAETRGTDTRMPGNYAVRIPAGQSILINVHAIDTRQTEDPLACLECRCSAYNTTPPSEDYVGGIQCCLDSALCRPLLPNADPSDVRTYYLRYTVHYFVWLDNPSLLPVSIYLLDATYRPSVGCLVEYDVPQCNSTTSSGNCIYALESAMPPIPTGGQIVYAVAHQHVGGINATILRQDGRGICTSIGVYGTGNTAGNETGYLVGMTNCGPDTLTNANVSTGESIHLRSLYNNTKLHSGVMSLALIAVYSP